MSETYGYLIVESVAGSGDKAVATCACQCGCGSTVKRNYPQLKQSVRQGIKPVCKAGQRKLRSGLRLEGRRL